MPEKPVVGDPKNETGLDSQRKYFSAISVSSGDYDWSRTDEQEANLFLLIELIQEYADTISLPFNYDDTCLQSESSLNLYDRVTSVVLDLLHELLKYRPELKIQGFWTMPKSSELESFKVDIIVLCGDQSEYWLVPLQLTSNYRRADQKAREIRSLYGSRQAIPVIFAENQRKNKLPISILKNKIREAILDSGVKVRIELPSS